jgi:hypothetical protein
MTTGKLWLAFVPLDHPAVSVGSLGNEQQAVFLEKPLLAGSRQTEIQENKTAVFPRLTVITASLSLELRLLVSKMVGRQRGSFLCNDSFIVPGALRRDS